MRAIVFTGEAGTAEIQEVQLAAPKAGEVRVKIAAAGVCHSDLHVKRGEWDAPLRRWSWATRAPASSPNSGDGVTSLAVGDHVVLSWVPPCGECRYCRSGHEARCQKVATVVAPRGVLLRRHVATAARTARRSHHYLGVSSFAEEVVVPASRRHQGARRRAARRHRRRRLRRGDRRRRRDQHRRGRTGLPRRGDRLRRRRPQRRAGRTPRRRRAHRRDRRARRQDRASPRSSAPRIGSTRPTATRSQQLRALLPDGVDYAFDAIGRTVTTEQAIQMLGLGGAAVIVGLPPTGARASFEPLVLAEADQRILGSNYGSRCARRSTSPPSSTATWTAS